MDWTWEEEIGETIDPWQYYPTVVLSPGLVPVGSADGSSWAGVAVNTDGTVNGTIVLRTLDGKIKLNGTPFDPEDVVTVSYLNSKLSAARQTLENTSTIFEGYGQGAWEAPVGFEVVEIEASQPLRLRLYADSISPEADALRAPGAPVSAGVNLILEHTFTEAGTVPVPLPRSVALYETPKFLWYNTDGFAFGEEHTIRVTIRRTE
jgi:hypothetical protein